PILNEPDRILAAKVDVLETGVIERAQDCLRAGLDFEREPLIEWRTGHRRVSIVGVSRSHVVIENVPVPELAVAAEIQLSRTNPADRHADFVERRTGVKGALAALE